MLSTVKSYLSLYRDPVIRENISDLHFHICDLMKPRASGQSLYCHAAMDHTTLYRWVQHYAPEMEKRLRWYWKPSMGYSWRVDETYVKVKGEWPYLYRAVDKQGRTIDFYLSAIRNTQAAKRDTLQEAIQLVKKSITEFPLQFQNFRD